MAKHQFQTEVTQLLHLMINSLYSNKEIFLRELVSNASDALEKLQYMTLTDDTLKTMEFNPKISVKADSEKKTLTIEDNGLGMNSEDLVANLGTIASSGTKSFIQKLSGDAKKDSQLIGQFGVGFYSAFMVADKIEVTTKKVKEEQAYRWVSDGSGEYEIEDAARESQGTTIILHMKEDADEYLESFRIESIIRKYSDHIPFPIFVTKTQEVGEGEQKETKEVEEQANKASALWRVPKSKLSKDEYIEFYKTISHDSEDPITWIHSKAEGTLEYTTLFYIPKNAPFDMYRVDYQPGVKLYVKRVFITDDEKELLPQYLRFVRGIIDSEDLPLNVSREILQQNRILANIRSASVKKILSEIEKIAKDDEAKYLEFFAEFGGALKEGLYSDFENKDRLLDLMRFKTTKSPGKKISLKEYKERMQEGQENIYYIMGENFDLLLNSPLIESFKKKDIEVVIMDEEVDGIVMPMINEYDKIPLKSVNTTEIDKEEDKEIKTEDENKFSQVVTAIKDELGEKVADVKVSRRLSESPACIVLDENDPNMTVQKMMKQMGQTQNLPEIKPILEINPEHQILSKLLLKNDTALTKEVAWLLFDEAKLLEGMQVDDIVGFSKRMNRIIGMAI